MEVGVWEWELRLDRVECDPVLRRMVGRSLDGLPIRFEFLCQLIHPEDLGDFRAALQLLVDGLRDDLELNCRFHTRWGEVRQALLTAVVLERAPGGKAVRVGGTLSATPHAPEDIPPAG